MSATQGSWQELPYSSPILPVHAALLPPGTDRRSKILLFSGSGNNPSNRGCTNCSAVWDYENGTISQVATPVDAAGLPLDLFCAGQSLLPDGRVLVAGGTLQYDPFYGLPDAFVFDRNTQQWATVQSMNAGRWYPTQVTLRDGTVLALSGFDENGLLDTYPEIYSPSSNRWTVVSPSQNTPTSRIPMYPHVFLMRDGRLFYSGGYMGNREGATPRILTLPIAPSTQAIGEQVVGGLEALEYGDQAASVLLPLAQEQRVMIIGGADPNGNATNRVNIVQLPTAAQSISNPTYTAAPSLNFARMHHNAVLLPDRTVFVCNGSAKNQAADQATLAAEIYNPATNTWTVAAQASVTRLYHSVALLLPDGRVVTAGGNPARGTNELRLEIYSPPYLFKGPQPVINSAPQQVRYGAQFQIQTPQARNIKWVNLIRPMAPTHGCDTEQRLENMVINFRTRTSLTVRLTSNPNLAPPGWYMLFITDNNGVPSVAKWMHLTS